MVLRHLPASGYVSLPWKNGQGLTEEICLMPEGASREAFDLRVSRATIAAPGLFSPFPGVDRAITVVEGKGLVLQFADGEAHLAPLVPFVFDSGLTPDGQPECGQVRVLNVMVSRRTWRIESAQVLTGLTELAADLGTLRVIFSVEGVWSVEASGKIFGLTDGDTVLSDGKARLIPTGQGTVLVVSLTPAGQVGAER